MTSDADGLPELKQRLAELAVSIGARIRLARRNAGLNQSELARRLGLVPQQINKYESGVNRVTSPMLLIIAEELGVSAPSLLGLQEYTGTAVLREMSTVENLQLLKAFSRLSPRLRGNVLSLAETLAGEGA